MQKYKIFFDQSFLANRGGIGRDSRRVLEELRNLEKENLYEITLIDPTAYRFKCLSKFPRKFLRMFNLALRFTCIALNRPIYLEFPNDSIFFQSQLSIFSIRSSKNLHALRVHDIFPVTHPEWFRVNGCKAFEISLKNINSKHKLLCDSQSTKNSLTDYFQKKSMFISASVVYCVPEIILAKECNNCDLCTYRELHENFYIAVSTIEPRKNYSYLISTWKQISNSKISARLPDLLIVGAYGWKAKRTFFDLRFTSNKRIFWAKKSCDGSLSRAILQARGLISSTFDEGFNLPPAESLLLGTPIFLSDIPVHREIYGNQATFFDIKDPYSLTSLVLNNEHLSRERSEVKRLEMDKFVMKSKDNLNRTLRDLIHDLQK